MSAALKLMYPEPSVIKPSSTHTATLIMMHGLGDTAAGWLPVGLELKGRLPHVKWIFPTAPTVCACMPILFLSSELQPKAMKRRREKNHQGALVLGKNEPYNHSLLSLHNFIDHMCLQNTEG
jgi:predicted esterase